MSAAVLPLVLRELDYSSAGQPILEAVDLLIAGGGPSLILGANGSGKSVLMRLMHGLLKPVRGSVSWGGLSQRPGNQAMVFQHPVMLRSSALANVAYGLKLAGMARRERIRLALEMLERVGLGALAGRSARVMSVGEQQRLALARAWALAPAVMFLDEPTASLDPAAASAVEAIIGDIAGGGCKIVMSTHNLAQARRLAHEIVFMHRGRVVEQTPAAQFFERPRSAEAAAFIQGELAWI